MARSGVYRRAFVSLDTTEDGKRPNQKGLAFMANIKSQKKRIITNEKRRMRNRAVKSELKTAVRHVKDAVAEGNGKDAYAFACEACRLMDKAASKGVIHKNQAANRKSGIMRLANTVVTAEDIAAYEKPAPKPQKTGSKKAEAKAARKAAMAAASEEKAKRREKQLKEEKKAAEDATAENKALFDAMKDALNGKVKEVKVSTRLKDHPVCLSADGPLSIEMEKVLSKQPGSEGVKSDKVLELNVNHPVFAVLKAAQEAGDTEKLKKYSALLYAQAQLIEGLPVDDPAAYAEAVCSLMQ